MGMAASQARLLSLQARKSNLEYQGQQINQERTILSQQCTSLYNSLLAMEVPTPPSTQEYTTVEYTGQDGATNFSLGAIKPSGENYLVEMQTSGTGDALKSDYGSKIVKAPEEKIKLSEVDNTDIVLNLNELSSYYVKTSSDGSEKYEQLNSANAKVYLTETEGGEYNFKTDGSNYTYYKLDPSGDEIGNPDADKITVGGHVVYDFNEAKSIFNQFAWDRYEDAIRNSFGDKKDPLDTDDFYVYIDVSDTNVETVKFVLKTDAGNTAEGIGDGFAKTYSYTSNGTFTESKEVDQCKLEFDTQGRITKLCVPQYDDNNVIVGYRDIDLKATTVTDNLAYEDAYNQYEYKMYEYDKKQQEINAKTEIIQQEDRNLELKLTRLDNERKMIEKETEALDKVIGDNIDKSFKTFSG